MTSASIDGQMVPLLRFGGGGINAHRTLVMNPQAGIDYASISGYEGGLVMVATQPNAGTHAVYTCSFPVPEAIGMRYFLSGDPNCEGQQHVSDNWGLSQFYMADTPIDGMSRPLYRCVNGGSDHLDTTDPNECYAAGYRVEGILGFGG